MIIHVLNTTLRVMPDAAIEVLACPGKQLSPEEVADSALYTLAREAALTGVEQSVGDMRVLPPDAADVCAVFMFDCRISVDPNADSIHCK